MSTIMTRLLAPTRLQAIGRYKNSLAPAGSAWARWYSLQPRNYISFKPTTPRNGQRFRCVSKANSISLFARPRITPSSRSYASEAGANASTIQGTIGKGASGVPEEAQRAKERLQAPDHLNEKEKMIFEKLEKELEPMKLEVQDISGGCGSMYGIDIASERFRGLSMLKQQRLVNEVLGEEIKAWHGVQLKTRVP